MPSLVARLIPGALLDQNGWNPPHPRAVRRAFVKYAMAPAVLIAAAGWYANPMIVLLAVPVGGMAYLFARVQVRHMGHCVAGAVFMCNSGWIGRHVSVATVGKVQSTGVVETPFDRRNGMAALVIDTAGAAGGPHRLDVPYLDGAVALSLAAVIGARAAETALNW